MNDLRNLLAVIAAIAASLALAGVASAAGGTHTQSFTNNFHGTQTSSDLNPCTGTTVDVASTTNFVNHITYFPASDESWFTFTEEDKVTAVDETTGVVYTGHDTIWGNSNVNRQNQNSSFTNTLHLSGSDGSSIVLHEVAHFTMTPSGDVSVSFDKARLTCG